MKALACPSSKAVQGLICLGTLRKLWLLLTRDLRCHSVPFLFHPNSLSRARVSHPSYGKLCSRDWESQRCWVCLLWDCNSLSKISFVASHHKEQIWAEHMWGIRIWTHQLGVGWRVHEAPPVAHGGRKELVGSDSGVRAAAGTSWGLPSLLSPGTKPRVADARWRGEPGRGAGAVRDGPVGRKEGRTLSTSQAQAVGQCR